jgi:hypothetical protein
VRSPGLAPSPVGRCRNITLQWNSAISLIGVVARQRGGDSSRSDYAQPQSNRAPASGASKDAHRAIKSRLLRRNGVGDGERALVTVQRRRADFAISRALAISDAPSGRLWAMDRTQVILKTDERKIVLELGARENSASSQAVGMRTGSSSRTTSRSRSRTVAG